MNVKLIQYIATKFLIDVYFRYIHKGLYDHTLVCLVSGVEKTVKKTVDKEIKIDDKGADIHLPVV